MIPSTQSEMTPKQVERMKRTRDSMVYAWNVDPKQAVFGFLRGFNTDETTGMVHFHVMTTQGEPDQDFFCVRGESKGHPCKEHPTRRRTA